ncbi:hypothetical protein SOVF_055620 [Spinacia oleracea]|uniref:Uncharacterized protein n=1 Tax=Spinacia oleracea TaxID=3562 RepID=A0A9R0ITD9_SPIOL|nr:uncharacterized protein LOC110793599 [Spinacia oleracea]KNA20081.1 hypothetical protein SOVF_055620 [Spinacia oleracea]
MASPTTYILSLLLIAVTISTVCARPGLPFHPCNTLIVSTYSFSVIPLNPNPNHNLLPHHHRPQFLVVSADLNPYHRYSRHGRFFPVMVDRLPVTDRTASFETPKERPEFLPLGFSSLRDRTKDILSVVASLLFGAACGALTAGTMYLVWSLFNHRSGSYRSLDGFSSDDDDNDDDDIFNPKKTGYVAIPASPVKAMDSIPAAIAVPVPAKESA